MMGDTGGDMMHAFPFSYTCSPAFSIEPLLPKQLLQVQGCQGNGNPNTNTSSINAALLEDSVSFARFASHSLSWDNTTSNNNNRYRYVEEAERFSKPGSVAQKKAFFEAHYKRIADAKKAKAQAAAQAQQQQQPASSNNPTEIPTAADSYTTPALQQPMLNMNDHDIPHGHELVLQSVAVKEPETPLEIIVMEVEDEMTPPGTPKLEKPQLSASARVHPRKATSNSTNTSASENSPTPQIEKPLLKNSASSRDRDRDAPSVNSKNKSAFSSFKSSIYPKTSKIPSPAKMVLPSRTIKKEQKTISLANKPTLQYMEKKEIKKPLLATTPARTPERVVAPLNAKTPNTRVGSAAYRAFQACMSPLRTPNTVTSARMSKNVSSTPQPDNTSRTNPPTDGSRTATPKWKILSAACSKSLAANRNKLQSPTVSTPFTLRTEERAARRKQKLEEKFNLKETPKEQLQTNIRTPKVQLQTKIKEKAENELRKLRRSFCFNAQPPPNLSKQRRETTEIHNNMKKGVTTTQGGQSSSSKLGKKLSTNWPSISQQPSCRPSVLSTSSPCATTSHFISSSAEATNHENTSPNIQYY